MKQIPIREPISESSFAREPTIGARRPASILGKLGVTKSKEVDVQAPEENPYKTANAMVPATSLIAAVQNISIPHMPVAGIIIVNTPTDAANTFGKARPTILVPFKITNLECLLLRCKLGNEAHTV